MSEESKKVKLTDEEIEKVAGGRNLEEGGIITLDAGYYYKHRVNYFYLPGASIVKGTRNSTTEVKQFVLRNDGYIHPFGSVFETLSLGFLSTMEKVAPENVPPIRWV